jgi:hypothetical protein
MCALNGFDMSQLLPILSHPNLTSLNLASNEIKSKEWSSLFKLWKQTAQAKQEVQLRSLTLGGKPDLVELALLLPSLPRLSHLDLSSCEDCSITSKGLEALSDAFPSSLRLRSFRLAVSFEAASSLARLGCTSLSRLVVWSKISEPQDNIRALCGSLSGDAIFSNEALILYLLNAYFRLFF